MRIKSNPLTTAMRTTAANLSLVLLSSTLFGISISTGSAAGTDTWVGNTSVNWNTAGNWTTSGGSTPPANGDSLVFGAAGSSGASLNNDISSLAVSNLTINSGASSFTLGGNALTLNGTLADNASVSETINFGITLGSVGGTLIQNTVSGQTLALGTLTHTAGSGGTVRFTTTGPISTTTTDNNGMLGGWAVIDSGTGSTPYSWAHSGTSGANNITAATTTTTASSTANWAPTTLQTIGTTTVNSLIEVADVKVNSGTTLTIGSGGMIFQGANFWLQPNSGSASVNSGLASGELFVHTPNAANTDTRITLNVVNNNTTPGILVKNGPGYLKLTGANTYSGGTIVNGGTLVAASTGAIGGGAVQVNAGALLTLDTTGNTTIGGNFSGAGTVTFQNTSGTSFSYTINGTWGGFTGTLNYNAATATVNFFAPASMDLSQAAVSFANTGANANSSFRTSSTGTTKFGSLSGVGYLFDNGTTEIGNLGTSTTFSGAISQAGSITKVGTGALTLSGANSYTSTTTVDNGSLIAGAAVPASGGTGPFGTASSAIALGDAASISGNLSPSLFIGGAFTMARPITVGSNNTATTGIYTLGGNTANSSTFSGLITLNQSLTVTQATSGTLNITGGITSGASSTQTVTVNNPGTVNIGTTAIGGGTGTIALIKTGAGTLTLSGTHSYTGNTTVSNGTLLVNGSIASGSAVTVTGSGSVLGGSGTANGATTINSSGALTPRPSGGTGTTLTFGGNLTLASASANFSLSSSSGGSNDKVVYGSSGTLTLDNTDTITVTNSVLDTANDYTLFTSTSGTVSMTTTPVLKVNGTTSDQTSTGNYKLQISGDGHSLLLHYIAAAVPPTVNSASASPASLGHYQTTTITVNVTPASGQSISSMTVTADGLAGAGDPVTLTGPGGNGSGNWTGTFTAAGGLAAGSYTISGAVNQSDGGVAGWSVSSITVTNSGPVWNGGGLDNKWSTGGNWNIGHGPGYGDTAVLAGTVQLTNNLDASLSLAALTFDSTAGSFAITNDGSTLTLTGGMTNNSTSAQTIAVPVAIGGAQMINTASGDIAISRVVSGAGAALTKVGPGTLTLSAVNTYGGATTIGNGTLTITGLGQLGGGVYSAVITNNGALNFSGSASQTLSGIISGAGSLTNGSSGTLTLSAANSYSGGSKLNSGTSKFSNASAFGTGTITLNGGTLQAGGGYTLSNNIIASSASTVDMAANNTTFTGNLSGSGAVTFNNSSFASTITLGGNNSSYGGTITFNNNNAVSFGSANAGSANAAWVFNDNNGDRVRINIGNGIINFGSVSGSGQLQNDTSGTASIISVGALNTSTTFGGTMKDNGTGTLALTKVGSGTLTLSGGNTYTGNTTVSNGVLALSGSGSIANSANIILLGATFDVSALSSTFTLGSGKTLIATNNATGTVAGNLSLGSGSLVLNYTNGTPSLFVTNGTFTFNNNAVTVTVAGTQLPGGSYKLIAKATAGTAGSVAGTLPSSVTVNGAGAASAASLQIINGELYLVVNHPPVANTMNVTRTAGLSVKIAWTDLMTNWSDADADAISLTSFNLVTTNGVTLQTNGTWILYTNNVNVTDRFTYTITDAQGATNTGAVNILINGSVTGTNSITAIVNGNPTTLTAYGIPGYSYITQRSTNLVDWVDISTNVAATNGVLSVTDSFSDLGAPPSSAYYRLKWQP